MSERVVVIGAGIGGLAAAARLARLGMDVTVLEAHTYPGGCAGTFYHQGYRFDAGATLAAGFYPHGPMDRLAMAVGIDTWESQPANPAMLVHLPGGAQVARWTDEQRWAEYRAAFGRQSLSFWRWQERTADALWSLALRLPSWPPQGMGEAAHLAQAGLAWAAGRPDQLAGLAWQAFRPAAARLAGLPEALKLFVDAQLLISAQVQSERANALYSAAALDLPRRGVVHLEGGMGAIARRLVQAVREQGGRVLYRQEAVRLRLENGRPVAVETRRGDSVPADYVVANLTPWDMRQLMGDDAPPALRRLPDRPSGGWGAFVMYVGLDAAAVPSGYPLHHQVVQGRPLGEGNTAFLSLSPLWDRSRAPAGKRALTISTHTRLDGWWDLYENEPEAYQMRRQAYADRLLRTAETALPDLRQAAELALPGTPVTFQHYTRRAWGWVGGFPQTSILTGMRPRLADGLWLVGDSIFPGQSLAAVALGGLRVAEAVRKAAGLPQAQPSAFEERQAHPLESFNANGQ